MTAEQLRDIQMLAFYIWERNGRPDGLALDHWLEAEYLIVTGSFTPPDDSTTNPPR